MKLLQWYIRQIARAFGRSLSDAEIKEIANTTARAVVLVLERPGLPFADLYSGLFRPDKSPIENRVAEAREHLTAASTILTQMQQSLEKQTQELTRLSVEIENQKQQSDEYKKLASIPKEAFEPFQKQLEQAIEDKLKAQEKRGAFLRRASWISSILASAAAGFYGQVFNPFSFGCGTPSLDGLDISFHIVRQAFVKRKFLPSLLPSVN